MPLVACSFQEYYPTSLSFFPFQLVKIPAYIILTVCKFGRQTDSSSALHTSHTHTHTKGFFLKKYAKCFGFFLRRERLYNANPFWHQSTPHRVRFGLSRDDCVTFGRSPTSRFASRLNMDRMMWSSLMLADVTGTNAGDKHTQKIDHL